MKIYLYIIQKVDSDVLLLHSALQTAVEQESVQLFLRVLVTSKKKKDQREKLWHSLFTEKELKTNRTDAGALTELCVRTYTNEWIVCTD